MLIDGLHAKRVQNPVPFVVVVPPPRVALQEHHRRNPHPNYEKPRMQCDQFILKHFAGSVTYDVAGFLEKNNDSLQVREKNGRESWE